MFENPRRGREARNCTTNAPKILDLKSSSEQIFSRKLPLGSPDLYERKTYRFSNLPTSCVVHGFLSIYKERENRLQYNSLNGQKSAHGPHRRNVIHILCKVSCSFFCYWNPFIFVGYGNDMLINYPLIFECYVTLLTLHNSWKRYSQEDFCRDWWNNVKLS